MAVRHAGAAPGYVYVRGDGRRGALKPLTFVLAAALVLALAFQAVPAHGQAPAGGCKAGTYYVASLNAGIDPGAADFLTSSISNAESVGACNFVLVLVTDGGDGASMQTMITAIQGYQQWGGNFTTVVAPQGAYAFSAGSYIAESSNQIFMEPGTTIGSATPIVSGIPTGETNSTMTKDINAFASYMSTLTAGHGRNQTATSLMVTKGVSYPDQLALKEDVVNGVIDSTTVQGALAYLGVPASTLVNTPGIRSTLISVLSNPNVSSLLFLMGVFAVFADIYHPTVILSVVGVVMVALALFGLGVFGASPLAILLMVVGSAFIFLEIKTQHGISALIGVAVFVLGFFLLYQFPPAAASSPASGPLPPATFSGIPDIAWGLMVGLGAAVVVAGLYLRSIREALRRRPKVNDPAALVGRQGTMESDLRAGGRGVASVASEEWSVTSSQDLRSGDPVTVKGVSGNTLTVEKLST